MLNLTTEDQEELTTELQAKKSELATLKKIAKELRLIDEEMENSVSDPDSIIEEIS